MRVDAGGDIDNCVKSATIFELKLSELAEPGSVAPCTSELNVQLDFGLDDRMQSLASTSASMTSSMPPGNEASCS